MHDGDARLRCVKTWRVSLLLRRCCDSKIGAAGVTNLWRAPQSCSAQNRRLPAWFPESPVEARATTNIERHVAAPDLSGRGSQRLLETQKPLEVVMAAERPDFQR
jgi:hypothetical protein